MKIVRFTKEIKIEECGFEGIIRKLSAGDHLEVQSAAFKIKDNVDMTKIKEENMGSAVITDTGAMRLIKVQKSIVKWNVEAEDSTPENPKILDINLENIKALDIDVFNALEREVNDLNKTPSKTEIKN